MLQIECKFQFHPFPDISNFAFKDHHGNIIFYMMYENKVFFKMFYRTASALFNYLTFKQLVDREKLEPLLIRKTIPVCMAQYEKIFSTTR
jgi:hypothetical protein